MSSVYSDHHNNNSQDNQIHVVLFPFMAKGHTIPFLHLARHLLRLRHRDISVTFFTTPANRPFISASLDDTKAMIIDIPFTRSGFDEIPSDVESTDSLPSMSLFYSFALSTQVMQPHFEEAIRILPRVSFMVSDGFLWWTQDVADNFGFPRLVFYGMNNYALCLGRSWRQDRVLSRVNTNNKSSDKIENELLITLPQFPWIRVSENDFDTNIGPKGLPSEFKMKAIVAATKSHGYIVNSFYELESVFADYWNKNIGKGWCVGPLCLVGRPPEKSLDRKYSPKPESIQWLESMLEQEKPVLYVAFGSQAEISQDQVKEIAHGLEASGVNFLWVIKRKEYTQYLKEDEKIRGNSFEERVKGRGLVMKEWVDQIQILKHKSVQAFLSHCGWNSVLESICYGVPILAWPLMAEQPLNAKMVVEEIKVGLRVSESLGFVEGDVVKKMVVELMHGEKGIIVRKNVKEFADLAVKAMEEGSGSSWVALNMLIDEITCITSKN